MRLEVPLFQRQYVWDREHHWEPLWEDVSRKFSEFIEERTNGPVHFLGAIVLDQKFTPSTHVERRQVIDGQQRLTTFQILLAVLRDFCRAQGRDELADEFATYTENSGRMADPIVDRHKVWPTKLDRELFSAVTTLGSRQEVEAKYPRIRRKYQRQDDPRPLLVEAYLYFDDEVTQFFLGTEADPPLRAERPLEVRLDQAFAALKDGLQVVAIDLESGDDPQVIFETLNARGEPLLPADLLRNYIFLRAARAGESQEALYTEYWSGFDDEFWRTAVRQGRLVRPRSDLFMQHYLASKRAVEVPIRHLYVEYRHWIEREQPFGGRIREELTALRGAGANFRRLLAPHAEDDVFQIASFAQRFDVSTVYPLMLYLMELNLDARDWVRLGSTLESYLLRRAILGWSAKAYNRIFLNLIGALREAEGTAPVPDLITTALSGLRGESSEWPDDSTFRTAWMSRDLYDGLTPRARLAYVLSRLSATYSSAMTEEVTVTSDLSIEHLMPQEWVENWPLPDGTQGLTWYELFDAPPDDPRAAATRARQSLVQTVGNLTILTQALNSSVSNSAWQVKRPALLAASLLPINLQLHAQDSWDEAAIQARGHALLERAVRLWPGPERTTHQG